MHVDYAQEVSVGREHNLFNLRLMARAWECVGYERA